MPKAIALAVMASLLASHLALLVDTFRGTSSAVEFLQALVVGVGELDAVEYRHA